MTGGGGCVEQREQWEDPFTTHPDREIELSQTNRVVGGVCGKVVPRVQSKLSRAPHAHRGKMLLQDLQNLENTAMKRAKVRFSQEDTIEGLLWRETLGRCLGSHGTAEIVGRMCHGNGYRQETTRLHAISCTKAG